MANGQDARLVAAQRNEKTEQIIYSRFAAMTRSENNRQVLRRLAEKESQHHDYWQKQTGREVKPHRFKIWVYCLISRVLGLTFGLKLMEKSIRRVKVRAPDDEVEPEAELLDLIDEERLKYTGSIILGLNDALVELTGVLAGLTFALQNTRLVALTGLITGIAAALSMSGTGYLATKSEGSAKSPLKAAVYTGAAYVLTVAFLISPYLFLGNLYMSLAVMLATAILIIFVFNLYIAIAKGESFRVKFTEMALLSLGIAGISFALGFFVRKAFGVEV